MTSTHLSSLGKQKILYLTCPSKFVGKRRNRGRVGPGQVHLFFFFIYIYSIKNLQDELPITIPTNYSTKHYKDDNTTGSNRL